MLNDRFPGASPSAIQRALDKAVELDAPVHLIGEQDGELTFIVPSATQAGCTYVVRIVAGHSLGCSCEAGTKPVCWHRAAALLWLAQHPERRPPQSITAGTQRHPSLRRVDLI
jgi:hypothetical protein